MPTPPAEVDQLLIARIRAGDPRAWTDLIARYEGRLLAYVESRLTRRDVSEDIVQEAFVGFLRSLPNYDGKRPLESYLFSICAYKLTDYMRREGRRPAIPLSSSQDSSNPDRELVGADRAPSTIARSSERRELEEAAIREALEQQVARWKERGEWVKIQCAELLFVCGWANKEVAEFLGIGEQQVANYKFDFIARMRGTIQKQALSPDVFPELYADQ